MPASAVPVLQFKGYRFPPEIITHAVWLYHRFALSHRDVEELLAERGIQVSYEAIRLWCHKFGPLLARELRLRRPRRGDKWYCTGPSTSTLRWWTYGCGTTALPPPLQRCSRRRWAAPARRRARSERAASRDWG
jgi:hypothetical protein